ncbi:hypothetical protein SOM70_01830 [Streptomyces salinarius]|uniref:hypothetical protein n=1 Tax=Streptomyces salinarius TaxID=2762598 RepID=UPI0032DF5F6B
MKRYELRAEVYRATTYQDPDSGNIVYTYDYNNPEVIKVTGGSVRPWGSIQDFGKVYQYQDYLQLFSPTEVPLDARIGRVRNKAGDVLWTEDSGQATLFDVYGCFPENDLRGNAIDFRILLARSS